MTTLKFRLVHKGKIVGYEYWDEHLMAWMYSMSPEGTKASQKMIPHDTKDRFTGLQDKGGKDIWERDMVMYEDYESHYVDVGIGEVKVAETAINSFFPVELKEGQFGINVNDGEAIPHGWISLHEVFMDYLTPAGLEVIGTVHENAELLNQKDI